MKAEDFFSFKKFKVKHCNSSMKVNTDAVVLAALTDVAEIKNVLEIGSGCGVISLMLAQKNETLKITAIDIDIDSALETDYNFSHSPWSKNLKSIYCSLQNFFSNEKFDLIVSNPPFFENSMKPKAKQRATAKHNNTLNTSDFFTYSKKFLHTKGTISIIVPFFRSEDFIHYACANGLHLCKKIKIIPKKGAEANRVILQFSFLKNKYQEHKILIRNNKSEYNEQYISLLKDYLTIF